MRRPTGFTVADYGLMGSQAPRTGAYDEALRIAIRPGTTVLDAGAGTGILTMLACRHGAAKVYAVEPDASLNVAVEIAQANGFADRVVAFRGTLAQMRLDDPVDVVVSDLRGILPLYQLHIPSIVDARKRLLAPGGTLIPRTDTIYAALVEAPEIDERIRGPWSTNEHGLDLSAGLAYTLNSHRKVYVEAEQLLVRPAPWCTIDYRTVESPNFSAPLQWRVERPGTVHGLVLWFDTDLAPGAGFSNAPGQPRIIYGQCYFPMLEALAVEPGSTAEIQLRADLVGREYIWTWSSRFRGPAGEDLAAWRQSTFFSYPLGPGDVAVESPDFVPVASDRAILLKNCVQLMDGNATIAEIAEALAAQSPGAFEDGEEARRFVGEVVAFVQEQIMRDVACK
jgi:protein arginine N-methyltransferase 1